MALREALLKLPRYITTSRVSKHRFFVFLHSSVLPDTRLNVICRADDTTFGLLCSRIHEVWSLAQASIHGDGSDGGRPTYNAKSCFETFPFPEGLTPQDTEHQNTEALEGGALIPAGVTSRKVAVAIARAASRLNDLREAWLNPPEWTQRVPEVLPLGLKVTPYPDRILPRDGHVQDLADRTLTKLYNQRPPWLDAAHKELDAAVAAAYGWADYQTDWSDEEILNRLLALNLVRAATQED